MYLNNVVQDSLVLKAALGIPRHAIYFMPRWRCFRRVFVMARLLLNSDKTSTPSLKTLWDQISKDTDPLVIKAQFTTLFNIENIQASTLSDSAKDRISELTLTGTSLIDFPWEQLTVDLLKEAAKSAQDPEELRQIRMVLEWMTSNLPIQKSLPHISSYFAHTNAAHLVQSAQRAKSTRKKRR